MKITNVKDIEAFQDAVRKCTGEVYLSSADGDFYNLKSSLSQYLAIADLIRDKNEELELFAKLPKDQLILMNFLSKLEQN